MSKLGYRGGKEVGGGGEGKKAVDVVINNLVGA